MIYRQYKKSKGFTLIETLVAIAILMVAVVGPMSVIGGSLAQIAVARDQVVAVNLAQEGVEAVRQQRDSSMLDQWINGSNSPTYWRNGLQNNKEYIVSAPSLFSCGSFCSTTEQEVYQDASTGKYYQSLSGMTAGDTKVQFSRKIAVLYLAGNNEIQITSTVTWISQGISRSVQVNEDLFGISAP